MDNLFVPDAKRDAELYLPVKGEAIRYIFHPKFSLDPKYEAFPESTDQDCLHCEEKIPGPPFPIPVSYDSLTGKMEAMAGLCCGPACLKGYLNEHNHFDRPLRLALVTLMLNDVFGIMGPTGTAPPRTSLKKHGGPFTFEDFRGALSTTTIVRQIPFLTRQMVYEQHSSGAASASGPAVAVAASASAPTAQAEPLFQDEPPLPPPPELLLTADLPLPLPPPPPPETPPPAPAPAPAPAPVELPTPSFVAFPDTPATVTIHPPKPPRKPRKKKQPQPTSALPVPPPPPTPPQLQMPAPRRLTALEMLIRKRQ